MDLGGKSCGSISGVQLKGGASGPRSVIDCVDDFTKVDLAIPAAFALRQHEWLNDGPLLIGQIGRETLRRLVVDIAASLPKENYATQFDRRSSAYLDQPNFQMAS